MILLHLVLLPIEPLVSALGPTVSSPTSKLHVFITSAWLHLWQGDLHSILEQETPSVYGWDQNIQWEAIDRAMKSLPWDKWK